MRSFIIPSLFLTSVAGEFGFVHFLVRPNYLLSYSSLDIEKWQCRQMKKQHFDRPSYHNYHHTRSQNLKRHIIVIDVRIEERIHYAESVT